MGTFTPTSQQFHTYVGCHKPGEAFEQTPYHGLFFGGERGMIGSTVYDNIYIYIFFFLLFIYLFFFFLGGGAKRS